MNNVSEICRYWTTRNEYVVVLFDNETEEVYIINRAQKSIKIISELKNMNTDTLEYIADDFESFQSLNEELFYITVDDIEWIKNENCGLDFLEALKGLDVKPREE